MKRRREPKKKKEDPSIPLSPPDQEKLERWLAPLHPSISQEELARHLAGIRPELAEAPLLANAWVDKLAKTRVIPEAEILLHELFPLFEGKEWKKTVRRAQYLLGRDGSETRAFPAHEDPAVTLPLAKEPPQCRITPLDSGLTRLLFLNEFFPGSGRITMIFITHEEEGLVDCRFLAGGKKQFRSLIKDIEQESPDIPTVETSLGHLLMLLEEARAQTLAGGRPLPEEFGQVSPLLETLGRPLENAPIYSMISPEEPSDSDLQHFDPDQLFRELGYNLFLLKEEEVRPVQERIKTIEESRIILSEVQKREQGEEALRSAAKNLFPPAKRKLMIRRLEEAAYILFKNQRIDAAKKALVLVREIGTSPSELVEEPFLVAIVRWNLSLSMMREHPAKGPAGERESLIITP